MIAITFVLTLVGGAWVTCTAMLGERRVWVRLFLMVAGLLVTTLALLGIAFGGPQ